MKTILVLTDFSISADYAADYALAFAQNIEANLLLCNVYERPANEPAPDQKAWPKQACEHNSIYDLGVLMGRLKTKLDAAPVTKAYKPEIDQCSIDGAVDPKLETIIAKHNILLAVICAHTHHNTNGVFEKNHAWRIIDDATFPVMVIPYQIRFRPFDSIVFATDMNRADIMVLQSVSTIARYSHSEVLITHVTDKHTEKNNLQKFFNQVPLHITYPKISYNTIKGSNVVAFLKQQCVYIDLLVLVHHKHTFLQRLFGQNVIRNMVSHPRKPLLIFPQNVIN